MRIQRFFPFPVVSARTVVPALLAAVAVATPSAAQESPGTSEVFRRYSDAVTKVEVVESGSAGKAGVGSGFYAGSDTLVVTNYHVIASVVHDPDRYRAELVEPSGVRYDARVVAVDVVHDLAVLHTDSPSDLRFELGPVQIEQGRRLYSLGHPADLGLSIVEGTYNGLLQHTLSDQIHFTGSLNPGMSGGPALTDAGRVVGINVATAGNQLSFLVPVERAVELVQRASAPGYEVPDDFLPLVGEQIRDYQERYLARLFVDSVPRVEIGGYRLPTRPAEFFDCWGDVISDEDALYEAREHHCTTSDEIFVSRDHSSGIFEFDHTVLTTDELSPSRFYSLYSERFRWHFGTMRGTESDVTRFECESANVRRDTWKYRTLYCVRRYKKYEALYDVVFKVASLGRRDSGLVSTLRMSGVTFENAREMARRYLESIEWTL